MSLNVIISEVCRDPFLLVLIYAYDSKVSRKKKIIIMIIIIIKEASSRFGRKFDELIICSASRACSYLFNLDLIWILCFCQLKCFSSLPLLCGFLQAETRFRKSKIEAYLTHDQFEDMN